MRYRISPKLSDKQASENSEALVQTQENAMPDHCLHLLPKQDTVDSHYLDFAYLE